VVEPYPSEKYESAGLSHILWKDMESQKNHIPNHQPEKNNDTWIAENHVPWF